MDARTPYFHGDLKVVMRRISRRQYTDDFKAQTITVAKSTGRATTARQLDVLVKTLTN